MGYVIAAIAGIFVAYLVLWLLVMVFVLVVLPTFLVTVSICLFVGIGFAVVVAIYTLSGISSWGARTVNPDDVVSGAVKLPWRKKNEPFPPDRAWPSYLVGQWRADVGQTWRNGRASLSNMVHGLSDFARNRDFAPGWLLPIFFAYCWWLAATAGALLGGSVLVVIAALVFAPAWLAAVLLIGLIRSVDVVVRRLRKAESSCPACYYRTMLPAYQCDGCQELHRDLRPGWLGIVWRKCGCGMRLPTTVLRATRRLKPKCPRCGELLARKAGVVTDIRLPVFGPMSAGKTRLVYAALVALRDRLAADGGIVAFDDKWSRQVYEEAREIITSGVSTQKTEQGPLPRPITAHVTYRRREALLHLFDAAGEYFVDREDNTMLEFLDTAQGLVFVVDPFSMRWVSDQLTGARNSRLVEAHPAKEDPERVYHVTVRRLAEYGVDTASRHLAIAVVKSDLLIDLPLAADLRTGNTKEWLNQAGLDNLVLSAERDFAEVRYFTVASVADKSGESLAPANPFMWLMNAVGFATGDRGEQPVSPA